jgi:hypothetical protein
MCTDAGIIDGENLTHKHLAIIFERVQQDEEFGDDDPDASSEMSYQVCALFQVFVHT